MKKNSLIKLLVTTLVLVVLTTSICGCGNSNSSISTESISNSTSTPTDPPIDISIFKEVKASPDNIEIYQQEVTSRLESLKENENFITEDEWEVISKSELITDIKLNNNYYFTTLNNNYEATNKYHYPVVFRDGNSLVLWYSNGSGILLFKEIYGDGNIGMKKGGEIHCIEGETIISTKTDYKVTYSQETGEVKLWHFGKVLDSFTEIPLNSVYCGFSENLHGFIFKNGSDVYTLKTIDNNLDDSIVCIANNVKYVIDANYSYNAYDNSQPLFQMLDGSIKVYVNFDVFEPDDPRSLLDLEHEGGYNK